MMHREGGFVWPWSVIRGILEEFGRRGAWWYLDDFAGNESAGNNFYWSTANAGGYALVSVAPVSGDTVSRGLVRSTLTRNPAGGAAGFRRAGTLALAIDGYAASPETRAWARWRMVSAVPNPVDDYYASPFGIAEQAAGVGEPTEGMGLTYDRSLGIDSWVWRAWRSGVAIDLLLNEGWDTDFHLVEVIHRGDSIEVLWDGESKGLLEGPEIQPADEVQPYYSHLVQLAAELTFDPVIIMDTFGWGSPGDV